MVKQTEPQEQNALEARIAQLEALLKGIGYQTSKRITDPKKRPDYLEFGSERHALFLGLKHAGEDDSDQIDGWALADMTAFGRVARPEFLHEILRQKVNEWKAGPPPAPQSVDPNAPNYAPPMWRPAPVDMEVTGIV